MTDPITIDAPSAITKAEAVEMLEKLSSFSSVSGICDEAAKNVSWDFVGYNEGKLRRLLEAAAQQGE